MESDSAGRHRFIFCSDVVTDKDSLKWLGWQQTNSITYVFTKAYTWRADSIKKTPSLKRMVMKDSRWNWGDTPYTGRYIDYYNNGRIQNEGTLMNGKTNGFEAAIIPFSKALKTEPLMREALEQRALARIKR